MVDNIDNFMVHDQFKEDIGKLDFSRNSSLDKMIQDWCRMTNNIIIGTKTLAEIMKDKNIQIPENYNPADNDSKSFKQQLQYLVTTQLLSQIDYDDVDLSKLWDELAKILHQGGLMTSFEKEIQQKLVKQQLMFDSSHEEDSKIQHMILTPCNGGFRVANIYKDEGKIKDISDIELPIKESDVHITGGCDYKVTIDTKGDSKLKIDVIGAQFSCSSQMVQKIVTADEKSAVNDLSFKPGN